MVTITSKLPPLEASAALAIIDAHLPLSTHAPTGACPTLPQQRADALLATIAGGGGHRRHRSRDPRTRPRRHRPPGRHPGVRTRRHTSPRHRVRVAAHPRHGRPAHRRQPQAPHTNPPPTPHPRRDAPHLRPPRLHSDQVPPSRPHPTTIRRRPHHPRQPPQPLRPPQPSTRKLAQLNPPHPASTILRWRACSCVLPVSALSGHGSTSTSALRARSPSSTRRPVHWIRRRSSTTAHEHSPISDASSVSSTSRPPITTRPLQPSPGRASSSSPGATRSSSCNRRNAQASSNEPDLRCESGGLSYIGVSAGAALAGPTMEPLVAEDDPGNVTDYRALDLVDFVVLPHANRYPAEVFEARRVEWATRCPVRFLRDDRALSSTGGAVLEVESASALLTKRLPVDPLPGSGLAHRPECAGRGRVVVDG